MPQKHAANAKPGTQAPTATGAATTPGPTEPGPTEPGPTEPGPTEPGPTEPGPTEPGPTEPGPAGALAAEILAGNTPQAVDLQVRALADENAAVSTQAAAVLDQLIEHKPELLAPHIERLIESLLGERPRAAQCAWQALPVLARVAPAKVAKHLKTLQAAFAGASKPVKDGIVRTFVSLCLASVTYQKRLIEDFEQALREADDTVLPGWVEVILPALKGEPYAQARAIVEARLADPALARPIAQGIADHLGLKLRVLPR